MQVLLQDAGSSTGTFWLAGGSVDGRAERLSEPGQPSQPVRLSDGDLLVFGGWAEIDGGTLQGPGPPEGRTQEGSQRRHPP